MNISALVVCGSNVLLSGILCVYLGTRGNIQKKYMKILFVSQLINLFSQSLQLLGIFVSGTLAYILMIFGPLILIFTIVIVDLQLLAIFSLYSDWVSPANIKRLYLLFASLYSLTVIPSIAIFAVAFLNPQVASLTTAFYYVSGSFGVLVLIYDNLQAAFLTMLIFIKQIQMKSSNKDLLQQLIILNLFVVMLDWSGIILAVLYPDEGIRKIIVSAVVSSHSSLLVIVYHQLRKITMHIMSKTKSISITSGMRNSVREAQGIKKSSIPQSKSLNQSISHGQQPRISVGLPQSPSKESLGSKAISQHSRKSSQLSFNSHPKSKTASTPLSPAAGTNQVEFITKKTLEVQIMKTSAPDVVITVSPKISEFENLDLIMPRLDATNSIKDAARASEIERRLSKVSQSQEHRMKTMKGKIQILRNDAPSRANSIQVRPSARSNHFDLVQRRPRELSERAAQVSKVKPSVRNNPTPAAKKIDSPPDSHRNSSLASSEKSNNSGLRPNANIQRSIRTTHGVQEKKGSSNENSRASEKISSSDKSSCQSSARPSKSR